MATLIELASKGVLIPFEPSLGPGQMLERLLYLHPRAVTWMRTKLPGLQSYFGLEISPEEELDAFLGIYGAGQPLTFQRQFWPLFHIDKGIWELKTRDVRLFGWFHKKDCFVCSAADDATKVKGPPSLYAGYRDQAVFDRDHMDLDEPKFVAGNNPNDIISAFSFPPA